MFNFIGMFIEAHPFVGIPVFLASVYAISYLAGWYGTAAYYAIKDAIANR